MDIRYSTNQRDFKFYTTDEIRDEFLIQDLYQEDKVVAVYSHVDRMVTLGCMPVNETVSIDKGIDVWSNFGTKYFLERREIGIFNIGGKGEIVADDEVFTLDYKDCLYITKGTKNVTFRSFDKSNPAKFYMVSAPAHISYKTTFISIKDAAKKPLGDNKTANKRVINQFIPPDTHERRMEVYMYFEVPKDNVIFHLMGEPNETRHIVMHNEEAVISPSWSIHSAAGTSNYTFRWAMGGENQAFDDMDVIKNEDLR